MYHLLALPSCLVIVIAVLAFALPAVAATYFFRKRIRIRYLRSHNEIVGYIFVVLGGFYGLILGFVVLLVWESYNVAQNNAEREGSLARGLYRAILLYPQAQKVAKLRVAYEHYLHNVVDKEYPEMEQMVEATSNDRAVFSAVFSALEQMDMNHDALAVQMFSQLAELETYRSLRQLNASFKIWPDIWAPLVAGAGIILFFAILVDVESAGIHMLVNGLLGAFIGLVFYIILMIDQPFTGSIRIKPDAYLTILKMEHEETPQDK
ncbi:DUF4239 domain-containing protein [Mucilaginibacter sp. KACC 22773]|uniref:bestrophin-like domain n=1 Tax=Mucilaginibacter sp. KACC 22773 TaxID=3025671 RepID=UPI0023670CC0|nr:DUF4239 domain-containing protein [Mucilaginibacter sp. KACC 22773]WDF77427.1 DUF4239 domain-containing protein [Mucilaginibacter sp. KACC 22773]